MAVTYVDSSVQNQSAWTGNAVTVPFPTVAEDDIIIIMAVSRSTSNITGWTTLPSGFTDIVPGGGNSEARAAYKVADGTESGNFTVRATGGTSNSYTCMVVRGANTDDPIGDEAIGTSHTLSLDVESDGLLVVMNVVDTSSIPVITTDEGAMTRQAGKRNLNDDDGSADINAWSYQQSITSDATITVTSNVNVSQDAILAVFIQAPAAAPGGGGEEASSVSYITTVFNSFQEVTPAKTGEPLLEGSVVGYGGVFTNVPRVVKRNPAVFDMVSVSGRFDDGDYYTD